MSTKIRIISGFILMAAILAVVSIIGYGGINKASTHFLDYVRFARLNVDTSDVEIGINQSAYYLEKFMRLSDAEDMRRSIAAQQKGLDTAKKSLEYLVLSERKEMMGKVSTRLETYVEELRKMGDMLEPWYRDYLRIIRPNFKDLEKY
ncbi:MAG: hypothetical protein LBS65_00415, partial [Desulfovibrio sp.]|nr:hypothetical protein [Desulfovibrio sp.]